eukprot:TRINITY_DN40444_c0_g1_i1.p1 TRINITY_DN40444_c0_g1~~TRINITY_DN40444_c0_g1_i1.p1  ORF type:complete len:369 (+),score=78.35 TRINITY_DN40444_c0_g1_i1:100-1206(+)
MGKKAKGQKHTGTPDVVKFKQFSREFWLLKECVHIQESLPFVAVDALDDQAFMKVARFLNMVGLLADWLQVESNKDYRFNNHPKYLFPTPQFFPFGFDVDVIRSAREVQAKPFVVFNGRSYQYPEELRKDSIVFLTDVDGAMTKIASMIEPCLRNDFANGLKRFKYELKDDLQAFDAMWSKFEEEFLKARLDILNEVFDTIDKFVQVEFQLTQAEERLDIGAKQRLENELMILVEDFTHVLFPETAAEEFHDDVIPLAEACIFYESKCTEEWLLLAKYLIKDYLELRIFIQKIPERRLVPELKENHQLMRLLKNFHSSVVAAREALTFVAKLPKLIHAKTENWMTKKLLDADLKYIQKTAHLAMEGVS